MSAQVGDVPSYELRVEVGVPFEWHGMQIVAVEQSVACIGCIARTGSPYRSETPDTCHTLPNCTNKVFMTIADAVTYKLTGKLP